VVGMFNFFKKNNSLIGLSKLKKEQLEQPRVQSNQSTLNESDIKRIETTNYSFGYADGFEDGRVQGRKEGYSYAKEKFVEQYEAIIQKIKQNNKEKINQSFEQGRKQRTFDNINNCEEAYNNGYEKGFNNGINIDIEDAYKQGYEAGLKANNYDPLDEDCYEPEIWDEENVTYNE
jgi:flagellar biosynthesis/type III secretory pathway protein FliH